VELEVAVGRGKSNNGAVTISELGVRTRKTNFRSPLLETESAYTPSPSSAVRQVKVARPQPRSPAPRADPEGQFVYK